jgi:chromosome segregation ATPase
MKTQEDLVYRLRGEKIKAAKRATDYRNHMDPTLLNEKEELKDEGKKNKDAGATVKAAEEARDQAKTTARNASRDARRLERQIENEQKRSQDLERDLEQEKKNAAGAIKAAKEQHERGYADQAAEHHKETTRYESEIKDEQAKAEEQAADRQKEHGLELENARSQMAELQERSEKAAEDAAKQFEQLQQQNSEHKTLQHRFERTESENKALRTHIDNATTTAEQTKKLQQDPYSELERRQAIIEAREAQVLALQNRIKTMETELDQHRNNAAKGAADTNNAWNQTNLPTHAAKGAADMNMAWTQTSLSDYSQAVSEKYEDEKSQCETAEREIKQLESLHETEGKFRTAEDVYEKVDHAAIQETTANLTNVVCRWHLGSGCGNMERCRWQHPDICDKPYCQGEDRSCTMVHRRKSKVCMYWSASAKCASHGRGDCRFSHPVVCYSSERG